MPDLRRLLPFVPVVALLVALGTVDIGMFALSPGPPREVLPLIELDGPETYRSQGKLLLTTVTVGRVEVVSAVRGALDPAVQVVPERQVVPRGITEEEYQEATRSLMDESKVAAVAVVLEFLTGYPETHGPGALVQDVVPDTPADGALQPGDLILAVDDRPVRDADHLRALVRGSEGRPLTLTVEAGDQERTIRIRPRLAEGEDHPVIGVVAVANFPFAVSIDSGAIGGPSAGLMWALGVYELLTREDLLGGREVAGTGTIDLEGEVGPVGGIEQKVRAAEEAGADVFVLPADNLEGARSVARDIRLVPVRSLEEAVQALSSPDA
jgi:Lon-like protease